MTSLAGVFQPRCAIDPESPDFDARQRLFCFFSPSRIKRKEEAIHHFDSFRPQSPPKPYRFARCIRKFRVAELHFAILLGALPGAQLAFQY
jgi:hypothetical protein